MARVSTARITGQLALPADLLGLSETSVIYRQDNRDQLSRLPDDFVDLIYLDPPFFSNRQYEVIWGDEAEVRSFGDRWTGGIYHYIEWMRDRVIEMKRVLKPTGSIYLHCDWHASHHLRVMLDDIFGADNFRNEIIWHYGGWTHQKMQQFPRKHDSLLYYSKSKDFTFHPVPIPWKREEYIALRKQAIHVEPGGREFIYDVRGSTGARRYLDVALAEGRPVDSVWDIRPLTSSAKERLGYPTQKPEALLERVIEASSSKGQIVLDPFAGCGTALTVAHRLNRRWIGMDISPTACALMKRRLIKAGAIKVNVIGMPTGIADLRLLMPFEFQNWIIDRISGIQAPRKSGDMGIDGWTYFIHDPVQIKQSESVTRPVIDNFETAVERVGKKRGYIIAFSFTRGAYEEVARVRSKGLEIHLIPVAMLLDRLDEVSALMGVGGGRHGLNLDVAPMPVIESGRHSMDELINSATAAPPKRARQAKILPAVVQPTLKAIPRAKVLPKPHGRRTA